MAIDLRLTGRVLTVTVNGESASIDLANIRGDDGVRGPQGPAGDTTSVTELAQAIGTKVQRYDFTTSGAATAQTIVDNWGEFGWDSPFVALVTGTEYPLIGCAFGYRGANTYGAFAFMDYDGGITHYRVFDGALN